MQLFNAYLRLTRPPNLLTAISDIWGGVALSGIISDRLLAQKFIPAIIILSISSVFLYAGGVVMNDVFDAELDKKERPERPIPSGKISIRAATVFGIVLLLLGIVVAASQNMVSGLLAVLIAAASVIYDKWGKPHPVFGPLNMGVCRGLNLLLGMSVFSVGILSWGWIAVVPVIYITAITLISAGEVYGGKKTTIMAAIAFYVLVVLLVLWVAFLKGQVLVTSIFLLLFIIMIFPPLWKALQSPSGRQIGKAVKAGVLGLILLNAAWVAAGTGLEWAIITALLLPFSMLIARYFAVT